MIYKVCCVDSFISTFLRKKKSLPYSTCSYALSKCLPIETCWISQAIINGEKKNLYKIPETVNGGTF